MGLDIHIATDNYKDVYTFDFYKNDKDYRYRMSLSRNFCNLMCRQNVSTGTPEFTQIASLTEVDISAIFDMEKYWDDESPEHQISFGETDEDRKRIADKIQTDRNSLKGNIQKVYETVSALIDKLQTVDNLDKIVKAYGHDTIGIAYYFSDFNNDKGNGYIGNNFGQDLRNFKRFLEYAKSKGTATVYFNYG